MKMGQSSSLPSRYPTVGVCALLLLAVALVFGQTVRHEFLTDYDDKDYVYENSQVAHGFTIQGIVWAFTHFHSANWHPLTWLSHMLDCQLYGLNHPSGHHLTNILLHAASAILVFLVLRRMTGDLWPSAFVAALFAIHPLRVESVAWVAERKDILSGLLFMLTLAAYVGYVRRPFSLCRYLLVTALFVLGLMAKAMLVTLPVVLLLLDYWPLERMGATAQQALLPEQARLPRQDSLTLLRLLLEKLPWLVLAAASCVITRYAQDTSLISTEVLTLPPRIANALVSYATYLCRSVYPLGLAAFYPHPQNSLPVWMIAGSLLLLVGVFLAVFVCRRKCPYLLVGWLWFLGMLVPVIGLVQVGFQSMADRYAYLPQLGLCIALAWGAECISRQWPYRRSIGGAASVLVVMSLACCAWQQASYWKDDETLWPHALACTSKNWLAHNNLGAVLGSRGRLDEAIAHYQSALEIKPDYAGIYFNLGAALAEREEVNEAVIQYRKALEINPNYADAHNNLGTVLASQGRVDEAITQYQKALEINPDHARAHNNLGIVLAGRGRVDEAIANYQEALQIKPDYPEAYNNLGAVLFRNGRWDEAIADYQKALEIKPDYADAHNNLGIVLAGRGRIDEAIAQYQKALECKPDYAEAHNNLGIVLARNGRVDEAITHYLKALEINPGHARAHNSLGVILAGRGQVDEAISHYRKALEIQPENVQAHVNLGDVLAVRGRLDEALTHYQKALGLAAARNDKALADAIRARIRLRQSVVPAGNPP